MKKEEVIKEIEEKIEIAKADEQQAIKESDAKMGMIHFGYYKGL